jgi:hypothetical protein
VCRRRPTRGDERVRPGTGSTKRVAAVPSEQRETGGHSAAGAVPAAGEPGLVDAERGEVEQTPTREEGASPGDRCAP